MTLRLKQKTKKRSAHRHTDILWSPMASQEWTRHLSVVVQRNKLPQIFSPRHYNSSTNTLPTLSPPSVSITTLTPARSVRALTSRSWGTTSQTATCIGSSIQPMRLQDASSSPEGYAPTGFRELPSPCPAARKKRISNDP